MTRAVESGFQVRFCRFVFVVIDTVTEVEMRVQAMAAKRV